MQAPIPSREDLLNTIHLLKKENEELKRLVHSNCSNAKNQFFINNNYSKGTKKFLQKAKNECKNRYSLIFNSMTNAFVSVSMDGKILEYNHAFQEMLGYTDEEFTHLTYEDLTPKKWHEFERKIVLEQIIPNGFSMTYQKEYVHKNGTIFPIELKTHLIKDEQGNPYEMWAIISNISERKAYEDRLIKSESRFRLLFDGIGDAVIAFDWNFNIVDCNERALKFYGYSYEEMLALKPFGYIHPDLHDFFIKNHHKFRTGNIGLFESLHVDKHGKSFPVEVRALAINKEGEDIILAVFRDISDRKKIEQNIKQQSERLEALLRTTTEGLIMADLSGRIKMVNEAYSKMSGYSNDELLCMSLADVEISESLKSVAKKMNSLSEKEWINFETKHIRKGGTKYDVLVSLSLDKIRNEFIGYVRDITEQVKLRTALVDSESRFRIIADYSHDWEVFRNSRGELIYSSPAFENLSGYSNSDYMGGKITMKDIIHPNDLDYSMSMFNKALIGEKIPNFEFRLVTKDSQIKHLTIAVQPVLTDDCTFIGFRASIKDVTDRVRATESLKESENRLKELLSSVTDYVISVKVKNGSATSASYGLGAISVTGYGYEEFLNDKLLWYKIVDKRDRGIVLSNILALISGQSVKPFEHRIKHKNGSTKWVRNASLLRFNNYSEIDGYDGLITDITEIKEAEEAKRQNEERLRILSEATFEGLISIENFKIIDANQQFSRMFNSVNNQHINCSIFELVSMESHDYLSNAINCGSNNSFELKARRFDGSIFYAEMRVRELQIGNKPLYILAIRDITERKETEKRIINASVEAEEHERIRVSRDLHDGIGPTLSAIKYLFNWFSEIDDIGKIKRSIEKGNQYIDYAIESVKEISNNLSPRLLDDLGYFHAIESFISTISDTRLIKIDFQLSEYRRFSRLIELNLYRITKELINNTLKHAKATEVKLRVNIIDDEHTINIFYNDNGIGFDLNSIISKSLGSGLRNITQRVKILNGNIEIDSSKGMGVIIFIEVPY